MNYLKSVDESDTQPSKLCITVLRSPFGHTGPLPVDPTRSSHVALGAMACGAITANVGSQSLDRSPRPVPRRGGVVSPPTPAPQSGAYRTSLPAQPQRQEVRSFSDKHAAQHSHGSWLLKTEPAPHRQKSCAEVPGRGLLGTRAGLDRGGFPPRLKLASWISNALLLGPGAAARRQEHGLTSGGST